MSEFSLSGSSSSTLLLVKRWAEFLVRYRNNIDVEELRKLDLEICRCARRENNLELSSRHLLQAFSSQFTSLTEYVKNLDLFSTQLSGNKAAVLRQACKTLLMAENQDSDIAVSAISGWDL